MGKGVANGPDLTEKLSLYYPFTGIFLKNYTIKLCLDSKIESIMIIDVTWILPLPRTIKNTIYVAGLFLLHRLWRNKLTRLSVSMIKMIGINCPNSAVSNKPRTWRGFRFVNFPQLNSFPPRRLSFRTLPFRSLMLQNSEFNIWDLTAEPSQNTEWPEVSWLELRNWINQVPVGFIIPG